MRDAVRFFDTQFRCSTEAQLSVLNPFEKRSVPYLKGRVLDYGCGMGNLSVTAARKGHEVLAVDASPFAIAHLQQRVQSESLPIQCMLADAQDSVFSGCFDTVLAIGLFMFMDCKQAHQQVEKMKALTCQSGVMVCNVLIEGTSYLDMFGAGQYCLFAPDEVRQWFQDWRTEDFQIEEFAAPGGTVKRFATVIATRLH
ncbi:MAG: methyltransferase domain-containing protein [Polaromonas sp.]